MALDSSPEIPEREKVVAYVLMQSIMTSCVSGASVLSDLYVQLRVAGGIFKGKKMSDEVAKITRYELIAYIAALTAAILSSKDTPFVNCSRVLGHLEKNVFSMQLVNARPAYDKYLARYRNKLPTDSGVLSRELVIHILFAQELSCLWSFYPSFVGGEAGTSDEYSRALIALSNKVEEAVRSTVEGALAACSESP